jgi:hypothetical protein
VPEGSCYTKNSSSGLGFLPLLSKFTRAATTMLRNAVRGSSRICYVLQNPARPFICAFCQPGARLNSTSTVEHATPDGKSTEHILKSLRKDIASQRKHIAERKAKGKPKAKATEAKPKGTVQGKPKKPKAKQAARESTKVLQVDSARFSCG